MQVEASSASRLEELPNPAPQKIRSLTPQELARPAIGFQNHPAVSERQAADRSEIEEVPESVASRFQLDYPTTQLLVLMPQLRLVQVDLGNEKPRRAR
jgi:hypothetical protein